MRRIVIEGRIIALCEGHARTLASDPVETVEDLRARYAEPGAKRSLLDRRSPLDRRILPPRPERRRRGFGRRSSDPVV
jgi:hypothetical protein